MSIEDIFQTMRELVADHFEMQPEEITMESDFEGDLGADSVDVVELIMSVEDTSRWARHRKRWSPPENRRRRGELHRGKLAD